MLTAFEEAVEKAKILKSKNLSDDDFKKIYGLYKQSTIGDINIPKPNFLSFKNYNKWIAWDNYKGTSMEDARKEYIETVNSLINKK